MQPKDVAYTINDDESYVETTMSNGWRVVVNDQGVFVDDSGGEEVHGFRWEEELDAESLEDS